MNKVHNQLNCHLIYLSSNYSCCRRYLYCCEKTNSACLRYCIIQGTKISRGEIFAMHTDDQRRKTRHEKFGPDNIMLKNNYFEIDEIMMQVAKLLQCCTQLPSLQSILLLKKKIGEPQQIQIKQKETVLREMRQNGFKSISLYI